MSQPHMSHRPIAAPASRPTSAAGWWPVIFVVTLAAYFPALHAGFIWDDQPGHVTRPELQSLGGLFRIWFEIGATQQYYPLLHSAFWLEHRLWGDAPFGYHFVNVLLHATAAGLFGALLRRLAVPGAWLAALVFALHPVCVESVAWVAEQKNTLSTVCYLSAALAYLRFDQAREPRHYTVATLWFVAALLSKTVTATLPAALLVVVWWQRGRIDWRRDVVPLAPWFGLGIAAGLLTAWVEHAQIGAGGGDFALGPIERGLLAARAAWFYLGQLLWPANLIFVYPRWTIDVAQAWQWLFVLGALVALSALWWWRRRNRGSLAAALFFLGTLFPALGFVNVFPFVYSYVADHFQYVASLGVIALLTAGGASIATHFPRSAGVAAAVLTLGTLGTLTWRQASIYRDVFTLYESTLAKNPAAWMAHNNLAIALVDVGRVAEALPHYEAALKLRPAYVEAENNYGYALMQAGRAADAIVHLRRAIELKPDYADAHNNLGAAFMRTQRSAEGVAEFERAIRLNPRDAVAHFNLGLATASTGHPTEAISSFKRALEINPAYADAELHWAMALMATGNAPDAFVHFERALTVRAEWSQAHWQFGKALANAGRYDEAILHFRKALEIQPEFVEAHVDLAVLLRQAGRIEEAAFEFQQAQQLGWRK